MNDWAEESLAGVRSVDRAPALLREDPAAWWAELAERDIGSYSGLKAAEQLGCWSWWHHHRAATWAPGPVDRTPPYCHDQPMWASPDGWVCRENRTLFTYRRPA